MKKLLIPIAAGCLLFAACKKGDNTPPAAERLTGIWQPISLVLSSSLYPDAQQDLWENFDTCQKDDLLEFTADHKIYADQGTLKCDSSAPQRATNGQWELLNGDRQLRFSGVSSTPDDSPLGNLPGSLTFDIVELNSKSLKLKKDSTIAAPGAPGAVPITFTFSLVKK